MQLQAYGIWDFPQKLTFVNACIRHQVYRALKVVSGFIILPTHSVISCGLSFMPQMDSSLENHHNSVLWYREDKSSRCKQRSLENTHGCSKATQSWWYDHWHPCWSSTICCKFPLKFAVGNPEKRKEEKWQISLQCLSNGTVLEIWLVSIIFVKKLLTIMVNDFSTCMIRKLPMWKYIAEGNHS